LIVKFNIDMLIELIDYFIVVIYIVIINNL